MRIFFTFSLLFFCCLTHAESLVEKLSKNASSYENAVFVMRHEKHMSLFAEAVCGDAVFAVGKNKMRFETFTPYKSVTIFDGENFERFEFESGSWIRLKSQSAESAKKIFDEIRRLVGGDYRAAKGVYEIVETDKKIILVPKNSTAKKFIQRIEIYPNADFSAPAVIEILAPDSDKTVLKILKIFPNPKNISDAFDISSPEKFKFQK